MPRRIINNEKNSCHGTETMMAVFVSRFYDHNRETIHYLNLLDHEL